MRRLLRLIWNSLAVIGLIAILSVFACFYLLVDHTGQSPRVLTGKIFSKALSILPWQSEPNEAPKVNPNRYPPVALSPHADIKPLNERFVPDRRILRVGPERAMKKPSDAAKVAEAGDIVEIDAGYYAQDEAIWRAPNLLIRGVGGRAILEVGRSPTNGKAIWLIQSQNITIENIGFKKCKVPDRNGAGIRVEGDNLTVRNCLFRENENGILCGDLKTVKRLSIEYSEFAFNGHGDGQSHGIYVGAIGEFIFRYNYVHHTKSGHQVKSRAYLNKIYNNYLTDAEDGNAAYAIDLPDGGESFVIGNIIQQSRFTENSALIHYGMPRSQKGRAFFVVNNTAFSSRHTGVFLLNHSPCEGLIANNLIAGKLDLVVGHAEKKDNIQVEKSCFNPKPSFPFAINRHCKAVDAGAEIVDADGEKMTPQHEYVHPLSMRRRKQVHLIDVGAFEYDSAF